MKAKSYIRIPIRFLPTQAGEFQQQLIAQTSDGKYPSIINLVGIASNPTPAKY
jgi:hypothetical protein